MIKNNKIVVEIKDVNIFFRKNMHKKSAFHTVLKNFSLTIKKNEILGIYGANGSGKSTLLKLIAGVIDPSSGKIVNFAKKTSLINLQVGFAPYLSGKDNIYLSSMYHGHTLKFISENMNSIISFANLKNGFIEEPIINYSNGMRARLSFSIAVHTNADLILIDEVLSVGDADFKINSKNKICELIKSDKTVVIVSHDLNLLKSLCTRIIDFV